MPVTDASHQPARRSGKVPIAAGEAAESTYASSAGVAPAATRGPITPAKTTRKVVTNVTAAASATEELTAVPTVTSTVPAAASDACATSRSRRPPPKLAITSVATPPKLVNKAIWAFPITSNAIANVAGITTAAREARSAASDDQRGIQEPSHPRARRRKLDAAREAANVPPATA